MKRTIAVAVLGAFCGSALATGGQNLSAASANANVNAAGVGIAGAKSIANPNAAAFSAPVATGG